VSLAWEKSCGIVAFSMFGIIFTPLKLPLETIMALFIVIDPIMSPPRVALNVAGVCAVSMVTTSEEKAQSAEVKNANETLEPIS
jgi:L-cystine uptake protein TcyP (sodium:dicarboxylate symporter family)